MAGRAPTKPTNLSGKTILVTGATSGIGKRTAIELASRKANVICASNEEKGQDIIESMKNVAKSDALNFKFVEYKSFESVLDFTDEIKNENSSLDCLVNSAAFHGGLDFGPPNPDKSDFNLTTDGFEHHFQINYLAHVLATNELLPLLKHTQPSSRIINLTCLHSFSGKLDLTKDIDFSPATSFNTIRSYSLTRYLAILHTKALAKELEDTNVKALALHPGPAFTGLYNHFGRISKFFFRLVLPSPKRAGRRVADLVTSEDAKIIKNGAFINRKLKSMDEIVQFDDSEVDEVWERSNELIDQAVAKVKKKKSFS